MMDCSIQYCLAVYNLFSNENREHPMGIMKAISPFEHATFFRTSFFNENQPRRKGGAREREGLTSSNRHGYCISGKLIKLLPSCPSRGILART
ncbi:hypothetical protein GF325_01625 [Candidatus Bathyarchaeota archaeon]|nr:hypothetical protein [Candidatus Bathyarchaeota archaeon]